MSSEEFDTTVGADRGTTEPAMIVDVEGFEGPLDLLLMLARQQKVDLAKISIPATLTLDGRSQAAVLRDEAGAKSPREWIFNQLHTRRCVRDERFNVYTHPERIDLAA